MIDKSQGIFLLNLVLIIVMILCMMTNNLLGLIFAGFIFLKEEKR